MTGGDHTDFCLPHDLVIKNLFSKPHVTHSLKSCFLIFLDDLEILRCITGVLSLIGHSLTVSLSLASGYPKVRASVLQAKY